MTSPPIKTSTMKRSRRLALTTVMATAGVSLVACGPDGASGDWPDRVQARGPEVPAFAYSSLQACKDAGELPAQACEEGAAAAAKDQETSAPRYAQQKTCEDVYGIGQCVPRQSAGGSYFMPLLTGFVIGQMMNGGYRGTGIYRDERDGGFYTGYGGRLDRDYSSGRWRTSAGGIDPPATIRSTPPRIQTRTAVLSRGGFGGRMSAHGYGG